MKTKAKHRPFSRVVCVLLTLLTVFGAMSSLFLTEPLEAEAASSWYTIVASSSEYKGSEVHYYGWDYLNKTWVRSGDGLSFTFTSGYEVQYGDQLYHASCAQMGYRQPTNRVTLNGLLPINAGENHVDLYDNSKNIGYGAHYVSDPSGAPRLIPYKFIFKCWYYGNKQYGTWKPGQPAPIQWTTCWLQEAISIAYRYEWDTRLMQKVTGRLVNGKWVTNTDPSTWTDNNKFIDFVGGNTAGGGSVADAAKSLIYCANAILEMAIEDKDHIDSGISNEDPKTGKNDPYGLYYKDSNGDVHVLRLLDTADRNDGADANYQDMFLYAVNETPPEEFYSIDLTKVDKDNHSVPLSGAVFELYKYNGSSWVRQGYAKTTDSSGHILWDVLPAGDYYVKETSAPSGYELNSTEIQITLPGSGSTSSSGSYELKYTSEGSEVTVYDPKESYKVAVQKEDERYTEQRRYLTGAWFALYKDNGTGTYVQYGEEQETKQREGIGLCAYWSDLPEGDYYVKETRAPSGYALNDTKVYFSLPYTDADGERGSTYRINQWDGSNADLFMSNVKYGTLKIKKVDIKGNPISGVTFGVYTSSSKTGYVKSATTGTDGVATFTDLLPGTYYLFETAAPSGYKFDPNKAYSGTVVSDTTTWANGGYGVENPPYSYTIALVKYKAGSNFVRLPGATFVLYKQDNSGSYTLGDGRRYAFCKTGTTDSDGQITWTGLEKGDYCYVETDAPRGYAVNSEEHYISFPKDGDGKGRYGVNDYGFTGDSTNWDEPETYWTPQVEKNLVRSFDTAREPESNFGEFSFVLEEWDYTERTWKPLDHKSIVGSGTVTFNEITYGWSDNGDHRYRVYEETGDNERVSYTGKIVEFTVTVTRNIDSTGRIGDTLSTTVRIDTSDLSATTDKEKTTFTNYVPDGTWTPTAQKVLIGRKLTDKEFTFTLEKKNDDGTWTTLQTATNDSDGTVSFTEFYYTLADTNKRYDWYGAEKQHIYRVREVKGTDPTVIYDDHTVTYTVTVSYSSSNATDLTITVDVSSSDPDMDKSEITTFTNYVPVKIEIEKDDPNGHTLAGAEFCLEWSEDGKSWANVKYTAEIEKGGCENADVVDGKLTTDDDGKIAYERLYPGLHYRLTETKAPSGMQLLTETAYEGVLPPDMDVTDPETLVSLRVVNQPVFTLPATGGHGFWNAALAVPLLCVSIAIIGLALGGGSFKKKKQK